ALRPCRPQETPIICRVKELVFAQCHPPAFKEGLVIGWGEMLQLGRRDPRSTADANRQEFPDALEERSLHRRIEPRHEHVQVGVEKAQGSIVLVPVPARQMAEGPPIMW